MFDLPRPATSIGSVAIPEQSEDRAARRILSGPEKNLLTPLKEQH
jgi:hypothetical protein